jgi:RNA polymerase sigma-70 factor (ECF subfamily)
MDSEHSPPAGTGLIERMLAGDATSFDDIVRWYAGDVLRLGYLLLHDPEEARDVLQESLIRLVRLVKEGRFRTQNGSIKGFLLVTARNLCLDRLKRKITTFEVDEELMEVPERLIERTTPDRVADQERFQDAFEQALMALSDLERTVLVLHEVHGENNQSIAAELHLTVNAVTTHLCRARRKLRMILEPYRCML